jgi:hypothetical protein
LGHVLLSSYAQAWARRCGIGPQRLEAARAGLVAAGALACTPLPQAPGLPPGLELWHTRADGIAALQAASTEEQLAVQACISGQSLAPGDILAAPPSALGASQSTSAAPAHARAARGERGGGRVIRNAGGGRVGAAPPPARPSSSSEEAPGYAGGGRWHGVLRKPHKATWMAEVELSPALADALGLGPKRANVSQPMALRTLPISTVPSPPVSRLLVESVPCAARGAILWQFCCISCVAAAAAAAGAQLGLAEGGGGGARLAVVVAPGAQRGAGLGAGRHRHRAQL